MLDTNVGVESAVCQSRPTLECLGNIEVPVRGMCNKHAHSGADWLRDLLEGLLSPAYSNL
jgi:hypothetical protein